MYLDISGALVVVVMGLPMVPNVIVKPTSNSYFSIVPIVVGQMQTNITTYEYMHVM